MCYEAAAIEVIEILTQWTEMSLFNSQVDLKTNSA